MPPLSTGGFVLIGDSHLVSMFDTTRVTNGHDALFSLRQAVDLCLLSGLPLVIAGDLFDTNLVRSPLLLSAKAILAPVSAGPGLFYIQGNHDKDYSTPWCAHIPCAQRLSDTPTVVGGHRLLGLDYAPSASISQQLAALSPQVVQEADGLVLHQALRQGLGFDGSWNCDLDWVRVRDVWAGDLHRVYDELWSTDRRVRALYPGSQYMGTVDETEHPSLLVVGPVAADAHAPYRREPLLHRTILRATIASDDDLTKLVDDLADVLAQSRPQLPKELQRPGMIVRYYSDIQGVGEVLREITGNGEFAAFLEIPLPSRTSSFATRRISASTEQLTLARLITERLSGAAREFAKDLAGAPSVDVVREVIGVWQDKTFNQQQEPACAH